MLAAARGAQPQTSAEQRGSKPANLNTSSYAEGEPDRAAGAAQPHTWTHLDTPGQSEVL